MQSFLSIGWRTIILKKKHNKYWQKICAKKLITCFEIFFFNYRGKEASFKGDTQTFIRKAKKADSDHCIHVVGHWKLWLAWGCRQRQKLSALFTLKSSRIGNSFKIKCYLSTRVRTGFTVPEFHSWLGKSWVEGGSFQMPRFSLLQYGLLPWQTHRV